MSADEPRPTMRVEAHANSCKDPLVPCTCKPEVSYVLANSPIARLIRRAHRQRLEALRKSLD